MTFGRAGVPPSPDGGWETFFAPDPQDGWAPYVARLCPIWRVCVSLPGAPEAVTCSALIDTGCSDSYATPAFLTSLGAVATRQGIMVYGASAAGYQTHEYRLDVALPYTIGTESMIARNWTIADGQLSFGGDRPQYAFVIGNDLLKHVVFTLDGPRKRFRIEPPA